MTDGGGVFGHGRDVKSGMAKGNSGGSGKGKSSIIRGVSSNNSFQSGEDLL